MGGDRITSVPYDFFASIIVSRTPTIISPPSQETAIAVVVEMCRHIPSVESQEDSMVNELLRCAFGCGFLPHQLREHPRMQKKY